MNLSEFRALLGCTFSLTAAIATRNREALDDVVARVERIHAQINARKCAGPPASAGRPDGLEQP